MVKKTALILGFLATSVSAFADPGRFQRIAEDPILQGVIQGVREKGGYCHPPVEGSINWMCLNGPQCAYKLKVHCGKVIVHNPISHTRIETDIIVTGVDSGTTNEIKTIKFINPDEEEG